MVLVHEPWPLAQVLSGNRGRSDIGDEGSRRRRDGLKTTRSLTALYVSRELRGVPLLVREL